jgi:hypothetical protein
MTFVAESYECTRCKDRRVVFTFDADDFAPAGDLISADIKHGVLALTWADKTRAMLPDVRDRLAACVVEAPTISVRWLSGDLLRGADLTRCPLER